MSEFLPLETKTGRVRGTSSNSGTQTKPIDFSAVYVIGLAGVGGVTDAGVTTLVIGQGYIDVTFGTAQPDTTWKLVECYVENTVDANPLNIWTGLVTSKTTTGFRLQLNGMPDTGNYALHWSISGFVPAAFVATEYLLSGPASGPIASATTFTVKLPSGGTLPSAMTVTPHDGGAGGTFTPATVTLTTAAPLKTFTYTPASYGAKTISTTNNKGLTDPVSLSFTCVAGTYTLTGPSSGSVGVASTNFTVALPVGGVVVGTVTVTPSSGGGGGAFTPTTVALTTGAPSATFTYTPATTGAKTISVTNNGGLTNPGNIVYTASTPFAPTDIAGCKLWLKADSLALSDGAGVATWTDSSGSGNNVSSSGFTQPIYKTNIVNGLPIVRFNGTNTAFRVAVDVSVTDFTVFVVFQTTGDGMILASNAVNNQVFRVGQSGNNTIYFFDNVTIPPFPESSTLVTSRASWNLGCTRRASSAVTFFEKGVARGSGTAGAAVGLGAIGCLVSVSALFVSGDIAEIIAYNSALSPTDRASVETYLLGKYNL